MNQMKAAYLYTTGDTINNLAETIEIEGYGCGIIEMSGKIEGREQMDSELYFLCCDICQESFVNELKLPILRRIKVNNKGFVGQSIEKVIWLKVTRMSINKIRLYITDETGKIVSLGNRKLHCTLLFIPPRK